MTKPQPPRATANPVPPRPLRSIRRTTSIDVTWPEGSAEHRLLDGRARDLVRLADGTDRLRAEARMNAEIDFARTIHAIWADPAPEGLDRLIGAKGGGHLRGVLRELFPAMIADAQPLYLLLDDISGTSLVSNWAWSQWGENWLERMQGIEGTDDIRELLSERTNVCWGFQPGFSSHDLETRMDPGEPADAKDLRNPQDPAGWHDLPQSEGLSFRRARRIDVWREGDEVRVEASFQDSAPRRQGGRVALHEYILRVGLDGESLAIRSLAPEPRVLPFHECPGAIANSQQLIGTPMGEVREAVLEKLRGPAGCTHLNDALRALAEVPDLLAALDTALA